MTRGVCPRYGVRSNTTPDPGSGASTLDSLRVDNVRIEELDDGFDVKDNPLTLKQSSEYALGKVELRSRELYR